MTAKWREAYNRRQREEYAARQRAPRQRVPAASTFPLIGPFGPQRARLRGLAGRAAPGALPACRPYVEASSGQRSVRVPLS